MAKKTTKKKTARRTAGKKKTASRSSRSSGSRGKKTTGKKAGATTRRKKTAAKVTRKKAATTSKKKTSRKKVAAASKKKTTKKTAAASKKKTTKKKTVAASKKKTTKKTAAASKESPAASGSKKKTKRKRSSRGVSSTKGSGGRKIGRSVAEVAASAAADDQGYVFINGRRVRMITTTGKVTTRRAKPEAEAGPEVDPAEAIRKIKTSLTRKELTYYRKLLLQKRAEIVGDLNSLETEALRSGGGNLSHMPIHMADIGSDTYEQDFMLGLAENERSRLREIDEALARIADGTYGVCQMTGAPIPHARLEAKPWAKLTIEAARQLERGWGG